MIQLPQPDPDALAHSQRLREFIFDEIESKGGRITFARYMELALYAPGLGYYSAGARKFGHDGDFVTAPEISPLFARCLARQCQQVLENVGSECILELGAGSGQMALDLLLELEQQNCLPQGYWILEVSADLRERQQSLLRSQIPHLYDRISWLDELPQQAFIGVILANEVLDALPVQRFRLDESKVVQEFYVSRDVDNLVWQLAEPSVSELSQRVADLSIVSHGGHYDSEINLLLPAWLKSLSQCLQQGMLLFIDYGFPRHEYYHSDRSIGTLMCHYRHRAHVDPFIWPGLQDITAHVDFTAVAESATASHLRVAGFATQAAFLLSCGLLDLVSSQASDKAREQIAINQQVQLLTSPAEMGELFKVMALTRDFDEPLIGFALQDQRRRL